MKGRIEVVILLSQRDFDDCREKRARPVYNLFKESTKSAQVVEVTQRGMMIEVESKEG